MAQAKVILFGASGTIGRAIQVAVGGDYQVIAVTRKSGPYQADYADPESIRDVLRRIHAEHGRVRAIVSAAGPARFAPLDQLTDADYAYSIANKLMGQVQVARLGLEYVEDGGSITLTAGALSRTPAIGSTAVSLVNAALEGFGRALALEAPRGIRVNVVSPPWIAETLQARGMDAGKGVPAQVVAQAYLRSVDGQGSGVVFDI